MQVQNVLETCLYVDDLPRAERFYREVLGLALESHVQLLRTAGFLAYTPPPLADGMFGPPAPTGWRWRPPRRQASPPAPARTPESPGGGGAFAALAGLVR